MRLPAPPLPKHQTSEFANSRSRAYLVGKTFPATTSSRGGEDHHLKGEPERQPREQNKEQQEESPVALGDALAHPDAVVISRSERAPAGDNRSRGNDGGEYSTQPR